MVQALANQSLLSGGKFEESGYVSVCDGDEVNIFDGHTATITVLEDEVLKGWRCPRTKLWRIPLQAQVTDLNMYTLLINSITRRESLNSLYTVPTPASVLSRIERFNSNHAAEETINNVYDIPILVRTVQYLHAAAGFPTKATWIKIIQNGNYLTWPLLDIKDVNKNFPESENTQKGHMRNQLQVVRSTKAKAPHPGTKPPPAEKNAMSSSMCMNPRGPCTLTKLGSSPTG